VSAATRGIAGRVRFILAAGLQNKLWQLHEALYRHQGAENAGWLTDDLVRQLAGRIPGLDVDRLFRDAQSAKIAAMINSDLRQVQANGINQTPSFLVKIGDAAPYPLTSLSLDVDSFRRALDDALRG
jgi:protein-disulfide isomerase